MGSRRGRPLSERASHTEIIYLRQTKGTYANYTPYTYILESHRYEFFGRSVDSEISLKLNGPFRNETQETPQGNTRTKVNKHIAVDKQVRVGRPTRTSIFLEQLTVQLGQVLAPSSTQYLTSANKDADLSN